LFDLQDLAACAALAKERGIVTIVDNSWATPIFQRPIQLGNDVVVHSASKYLSGHSDVVAGALVASQNTIEEVVRDEPATRGRHPRCRAGVRQRAAPVCDRRKLGRVRKPRAAYCGDRRQAGGARVPDRSCASVYWPRRAAGAGRGPVAGVTGMVTARLVPRLAVLIAVAVGLTAVAVTRSVGPFRVRAPVTTPPATELQQPRPSSGTSPTVPLVQAEPVYEGPLGDFIVGPHQGSDAPPCPRPLRPAKNEKIRASELYSPIFGENLEGFVTECADGKIVVIVIYGREV